MLGAVSSFSNSYRSGRLAGTVTVDELVEVLERGPGFAENEDKKLFAPFYSTKPTGSGLGLTISSRLVRLMGGRLELQSEPCPPASQ